MSEYIARTQAPISNDDARTLGEFLGRYAIEIGSLTIFHVDANGRRIRDNATEKTVGDVTTAATGSFLLQPVAIPLFGLLLPLGPLFALGTGLLTALNIAGMHALNKAAPNAPDALYSEVEFSLAGVSAKRRAWTEYMLGFYSARNQWDTTGYRFPASAAAGTRRAQANPADPQPWSATPRNTRRRRKPTTPAQQTSLRQKLSRLI